MNNIYFSLKPIAFNKLIVRTDNQHLREYNYITLWSTFLYVIFIWLMNWLFV